MSYLELHDPHKILTDCVFFDEIINVQKAGQIIAAKYPQIHVLHGIAHKLVLFFSDLAKIPVIKIMISIHRKLYS
eukprot:2958695-Ditylum_brightwellii.AAC.2